MSLIINHVYWLLTLILYTFAFFKSTYYVIILYQLLANYLKKYKYEKTCFSDPFGLFR